MMKKTGIRKILSIALAVVILACGTTGALAADLDTSNEANALLLAGYSMGQTVQLTDEEQQALMDAGILPSIRATCTKCGRGQFQTTTSKTYDTTFTVTCKHYGKGSDKITPVMLNTFVECDTCGYSYVTRVNSDKIECRGWS